MTVRSLARLSLAAALVVPALGLGGCQSYGLDVRNDTGQILKVELMDISPTGSASVMGSSVLPKYAAFTHKLDDSTYGNGRRVRFLLPETSPDEADLGQVELKVPEARTRYYNLEVVNGRLVARELVRGRRTENTTPEVTPE
jgi:hypothetical protein